MYRKMKIQEILILIPLAQEASKVEINETNKQKKKTNKQNQTKKKTNKQTNKQTLKYNFVDVFILLSLALSVYNVKALSQK